MVAKIPAIKAFCTQQLVPMTTTHKKKEQKKRKKRKKKLLRPTKGSFHMCIEEPSEAIHKIERNLHSISEQCNTVQFRVFVLIIIH